MPNFDVNQLLRYAVFIIIGGIALLALTFLIPVLAALIPIAIIGGIIYLIYLFLKRQGFINK